MNNKKEIAVVFLTIALAVLVGGYTSDIAPKPTGSVNIGNESQSTTTPLFNNASGVATLCGTTGGVINNINITGTSSGQLNVYNATTSDGTKRNALMSSSTIWSVNIANPITPIAYANDIAMPIGITVVTVAPAPTSTISYRCQ